MAADPMCAVVLIGLGLEDLSMTPFFIPLIKRLVRSLPYEQAQSIAVEVLRMATVKEVKGFLFEAMRELQLLDLVEAYH
jgi:signal transduction protein with GAF and PtsI domain